MAKIAFTKFGLKKNDNIKIVNINGLDVEIKQYLPVDEKLILISKVLSKAADENNFSNPVKLDVFTKLEILFAYTNISFTEKQKEDSIRLFDLLEGNNIFNIIINSIPEIEYNCIVNGVKKCGEAVYAYRNSILGILDTISADYSDLSLNATDIQSKIADPENLSLLKNIMEKLG